MEQERVTLSPHEAAEYVEFKRYKRETEVSFTLRRLILDASRRETDKNSLKSTCEIAAKINADGILVTPVNVSAVKRLLGGRKVKICCLAGGTGESLISVKCREAKQAVRQGAQEIRLVLCYYALASGNLGYLKREMKKVRRCVRRANLTLSLEDSSLGADRIATAVKIARETGVNGVCVRGDISVVLRALEEANGKLSIDCSGVENAEQLRTLVKAGVSRATTRVGDVIAGGLYAGITQGLLAERDGE